MVRVFLISAFLLTNFGCSAAYRLGYAITSTKTTEQTFHDYDRVPMTTVAPSDQGADLFFFPITIALSPLTFLGGLSAGSLERLFPTTEALAQRSTSAQELAELAKHESPYVRANVAANPHTSVEILKEFIYHEDSVVCAALNNPSFPRQLLWSLLDDAAREQVIACINFFNPELVEKLENKDLQYKFALHNKNKEVLLFLLKKNDIEINRMIAQNTFAPKKLLLELAQKQDLVLIRNLLNNINTPKKMLFDILATKDNFSIKQEMLLRPGVPFYILNTLSRDKDPKVRLAVVRHNVYYSILERLTNDENPEVKSEAKKLLKEWETRKKNEPDEDEWDEDE